MSSCSATFFGTKAIVAVPRVSLSVSDLRVCEVRGSAFVAVQDDISSGKEKNRFVAERNGEIADEMMENGRNGRGGVVYIRSVRTDVRHPPY